MDCKACGAPLVQKAGGRTSEYCSDRCRKAGQRSRERAAQLSLIAPESDVTKVELVVTKCTTVWDGDWIEHHPNTNEPGDYDVAGNYWCAACSEHRGLMNLGALLDWPEIFYFPDNLPGLQLTMVRPGAEDWKKYVRGRGRDAVYTVLDRARYEQHKRASRA